MKLFKCGTFAVAVTMAMSVSAGDQALENDGGDVKALSGMSVLGNNEAPKALVIVPWKSSELGDGLGIENLLDERAGPVDREVFMRQLGYYELRTGEAGETLPRL